MDERKEGEEDVDGDETTSLSHHHHRRRLFLHFYPAHNLDRYVHHQKQKNKYYIKALYKIYAKYSYIYVCMKIFILL